jgi:hypothetical protein
MWVVVDGFAKHRRRISVVRRNEKEITTGRKWFIIYDSHMNGNIQTYSAVILAFSSVFVLSNRSLIRGQILTEVVFNLQKEM